MLYIWPEKGSIFIKDCSDFSISSNILISNLISFLFMSPSNYPKDRLLGISSKGQLSKISRSMISSKILFLLFSINFLSYFPKIVCENLKKKLQIFQKRIQLTIYRKNLKKHGNDSTTGFILNIDKRFAINTLR